MTQGVRIAGASAVAILAGLLVACTTDAPAEVEAPPPPSCIGANFEGASFTHCTAVPGRHTIHTTLAPTAKDAPADEKAEDGTKTEGGIAVKAPALYRSLSQLAIERPDNSPEVAFATNAGMFDDAGMPIGYYVEEGVRRKELNTNEGYGNFHMLPNGVFYGMASGGWAVRSADSFEKSVLDRPDFGTQSGPMLVIDGKLHPKINPNGKSLKVRNGVGVDSQGHAHFVISDEPVSFGKLARYFKDVLKCRNALFLDGSVSSLWDPEHGRVDGGPPLGPLIVVEKSAKAKR